MDDGFSKKQLDQLTELFDEQEKRFDTKLDRKLDEQRSAIMLDMKSLIRQELIEISATIPTFKVGMVA